jgi:hypothetical protein
VTELAQSKPVLFVTLLGSSGVIIYANQQNESLGSGAFIYAFISVLLDGTQRAAGLCVQS